MDLQELKKFIDENLLTKLEAMEITKQSLTAFNQAVRAGQIKPFYDHGEKQNKVRLYLKSEVEEYARKVEEYRKRTKSKKEKR